MNPYLSTIGYQGFNTLLVVILIALYYYKHITNPLVYLSVIIWQVSCHLINTIIKNTLRLPRPDSFDDKDHSHSHSDEHEPGNDFNKIKNYQTRINSIWVNEMKAHEYNPMHIHQGTLTTGLSSVMVLKLPNTYGVEYSSAENPQNGRLQLLGSSSGQFAKIDYQPPMLLRDFYVFPYDMRHTVYPFNGTEDVRRTLAANMDVKYDPIVNRGA